MGKVMKNVCPSCGGWPTFPTKLLYTSWPTLWRCNLCFELFFCCSSATCVNWFGWSLILPAPCSIPGRWCWGWVRCLCAVSEVTCLEHGRGDAEPQCLLMFSTAELWWEEYNVQAESVVLELFLYLGMEPKGFLSLVWAQGLNKL